MLKVLKVVFMLVMFGATFAAGMLSTQFKAVNNISAVQKMQKAMRDCPQFKNMVVQDKAVLEVNINCDKQCVEACKEACICDKAKAKKDGK